MISLQSELRSYDITMPLQWLQGLKEAAEVAETDMVPSMNLNLFLPDSAMRTAMRHPP